MDHIVYSNLIMYSNLKKLGQNKYIIYVQSQHKFYFKTLLLSFLLGIGLRKFHQATYFIQVNTY
ncbi:unnamed protein product [Paramecium octaurelia]|uniref:Uncharacterized protein n=1 Tax=Paramecium octaurelia TaxID=43137 RepID=A0A8S1T7E8_PAROT|nr:unnamed protein product [Paramecium octaurelia]